MRSQVVAPPPAVLRAAGTSGKLVGESYFNNLFYLLYVYSLNGYDISPKTWTALSNRKASPLKSRLLYGIMRFGAGLLLKRQMVRRTYASLKEGRASREEYALD